MAATWRSRRVVRRALLGCLLASASLASASVAAAYVPPEVLLGSPGDSVDSTTDWQPAGNAPRSDLGRYLVGIRLQESGRPENRHAVWRRLVATPNGAPRTPDNEDLADPVCLLLTGVPGSIVDAFEFEYEGSGAYVFEVGLREEDPRSQRVDCTPDGPTTTVTVDVDPRTSLAVVGEPVAHAGRPDGGDSRGLRVSYPSVHGLGAGGPRELVCALDAVVQADGSIVGRELRRARGAASNFQDESIFERAGDWTCVARAGYSAPGVIGASYSPWSSPARLRVAGSFSFGRATLVDRRGPVFAIEATLVSADRFGPRDSAAAAGAVVRATIAQDATSRRRGASVVRGVTRARGVADGLGRVRLTFRLPGPPRALADFTLHTTIGSTPFVVAGPGRSQAALPLRITRRPSVDGRLEVAISDPSGF